MKKILILLFALSLFLFNCASSLTVNGEVCEPVGLFNLDEKCENVKYKVCTKNVVWSILAFETIIVPVILLGKKLYEPVEVDSL